MAQRSVAIAATFRQKADHSIQGTAASSTTSARPPELRQSRMAYIRHFSGLNARLTRGVDGYQQLRAARMMVEQLIWLFA
jgi:hypothetical protein